MKKVEQETLHVGSVHLIDVDKISPSKYQPRLSFDENALDELALSIEQNGLIQPISVRPSEDGYEIIAGERRYRACLRCQLKQIPCYILSPDEKEAAEMALVENIQREDLTAIEEAKSYVLIMRQGQMTQAQLAKRIGKSQSSIANKIRLLNLPEPIQQAVIDSKISERHARALLGVKKEKQMDVFKTIVDKGYTVRESEDYISRLKKDDKVKKRPMNKGFTRNIQIGINSVNQCVTMIQRMGIQAEVSTKDGKDELLMIVRFPKR